MSARDGGGIRTLGFHPDIARTALVDRAVKRSFVKSVEAVISAARGLDIQFNGDFDAWTINVGRASRVPPQLWACYFDLVQAAMREDHRALSLLATELIGCLVVPAVSRCVVTISPEMLGLEQAERYARIIDSDRQRPLELVPVAAAEVARIEELVCAVRAVLAKTEPALLDEIDTLGHQIVLATGTRRSFGGAATVFLWGAVVLNPARVPDRVTLVEALAHETAHALLFGLTQGADLTTNNPAERYASPLRQDQRPIEGIVHATYVLARMNHALTALRAAELNADERILIESKIARNRASYVAGLRVVVEHARFTPEGEAIFAACQEAMDAATA